MRCVAPCDKVIDCPSCPARSDEWGAKRESQNVRDWRGWGGVRWTIDDGRRDRARAPVGHESVADRLVGLRLDGGRGDESIERGPHLKRWMSSGGRRTALPSRRRANCPAYYRALVFTYFSVAPLWYVYGMHTCANAHHIHVYMHVCV